MRRKGYACYICSKNLNKTIIEKNISYTNVVLKDNVYLRDERNEKWEQ